MQDQFTQLQNQILDLQKEVDRLNAPKITVKQDTILTDQEKKKIVDSIQYNAQVTLASGTYTISNGRFSPNSVITATPVGQASHVSGTATVYDTIQASCTGGSCTISSSLGTDTRVVNVHIIY